MGIEDIEGYIGMIFPYSLLRTSKMNYSEYIVRKIDSATRQLV